MVTAQLLVELYGTRTSKIWIKVAKWNRPSSVHWSALSSPLECLMSIICTECYADPLVVFCKHRRTSLQGTSSDQSYLGQVTGEASQRKRGEKKRKKYVDFIHWIDFFGCRPKRKEMTEDWRTSKSCGRRKEKIRLDKMWTKRKI